MDTLQRVKDCDKSHVSGVILQGVHSLNFCQSWYEIPLHV